VNYEILHLRISPYISPNWRDMWDWVQHKGESRQVSRQISGIQDTHDLIGKIEKPNKSFERVVGYAAASPTPFKLSVSGQAKLGASCGVQVPVG
jgi:hypothetical protein